VKTYEQNQIRFKRDWKGLAFEDAMPFRSGTENLFEKGQYTIGLGSGRWTSDVDCWISGKDLDLLVNLNKGDMVRVFGSIKDVTLGTVELAACAITPL
jgi:hypothetical protein